jgi:asparagine synthase (glutamine-hydrolysing)
MSAILGFAGNTPQPVSLRRLRRQLQLLEHSGLEDQGILLQKGSELSLFPGKPHADTPDASNTAAPDSNAATTMLSGCRFRPEFRCASLPAEGADKQAFLAFDGHLDNEPEIRRELQVLGHDLRNGSQLDVLLVALSHWGSDSLSRLTGTFAIAFLNLRSRRLLLARDSYGTRPLYFAHRSGWGIYFASRIQALREAFSMGTRVNRASLFRYLAYNCMDHAPETFFEGIDQVPVGHCLEVPLDKPEQFSTIDYRRPLRAHVNFKPEAATETIREMVIRSVASQVAGQNAVGAALSGGFDSSFVTAAFGYTQPLEQLRLYTCVPTTKSGPFSRSEERWAVLAAEGLKRPLDRIRVTSGDLAANFEPIIRLQEEPFSSPVVFAQWQLFRAAQSDGVRLMLSGQGGDTIFKVSNEQILLALIEHLRRGRLRSAAAFVRAVDQIPGGGIARLAASAAKMGMPEAAQVIRKRLRRLRTPDWLKQDWFGLNSASMQDRQGFPMLRFEHLNSTACFILNRMPLLTTEIHDFISSVSPGLLVTADQPIKSLECAAMRGMVPDAILSRKERAGFPVPVTEWLDELVPWVDSYIAEVEGFPFLLGNRVRQIWQRIRINNNSVPAAFLIWRWVFLAGWLRFCGVRLN